LKREATRHEAAALLRGLIETDILMPDEAAPNGHAIELYGELGVILTHCGEQTSTDANARSVAVGFRQVSVVAGAGFEPAAFRL
jgi:hypothetical protein